MRTARQEFGLQAEGFAERWFCERGFVLIERNWRCRHGEIDLVLRKDTRIHFVEVKARSTIHIQHALEAIDERKRLCLERAIEAWREVHPVYVGYAYQVDAFCVWLEAKHWRSLWIEGI